MKKTTYLIIALALGFLNVKAQSEITKKVTISKLLVYEKDNRLFIDWATDGTAKTNYWEVQGSVDGKRFSTLAIVMGPDPGKAGEQYEYKGKIDTQNQAAYYRVVHVQEDGEKQPSNIIQMIKLGSMSFVNPDIRNKVPVLL